MGLVAFYLRLYAFVMHKSISLSYCLKVYLESYENSVFFLKTDDEYRQFIEKYSAVRTEFETKMTDACKVIAVNVFIC